MTGSDADGVWCSSVAAGKRKVQVRVPLDAKKFDRNKTSLTTYHLYTSRSRLRQMICHCLVPSTVLCSAAYFEQCRREVGNVVTFPTRVAVSSSSIRPSVRDSVYWWFSKLTIAGLYEKVNVNFWTVGLLWWPRKRFPYDRVTHPLRTLGMSFAFYCYYCILKMAEAAIDCCSFTHSELIIIFVRRSRGRAFFRMIWDAVHRSSSQTVCTTAFGESDAVHLSFLTNTQPLQLFETGAHQFSDLS